MPYFFISLVKSFGVHITVWEGEGCWEAGAGGWVLSMTYKLCNFSLDNAGHVLIYFIKFVVVLLETF